MNFRRRHPVVRDVTNVRTFGPRTRTTLHYSDVDHATDTTGAGPVGWHYTTDRIKLLAGRRTVPTTGVTVGELARGLALVYIEPEVEL